MRNSVRNSLQVFARGICRVLAFPFYLLYLGFFLVIPKKKSFQGFSQLFSLAPGIIGEYLRREFYRLVLKSCSKDCCISFGTIFSTDDVEIGEGVYIGSYCVIGRSRIARNVLLSSRVSILSGIHQHNIESLEIPIKEQDAIYTLVSIGEDCWIGEGAIVGADVGAHSIIAAGSVILKEVDPFSIMLGNPGRLIRYRK